MFMSSSMRWRSGLMGVSLIVGSCLEVGVLDPSILKTERPPVTCARSNGYCGRCNAPDRPASALPRERVRSLAHMRHTSHTASRSGSLRLDARCADHPAPESEVCQGLMTKTAPQALGVPHNRFGSAWRQHSFLDTSHGHGDFN